MSSNKNAVSQARALSPAKKRWFGLVMILSPIILLLLLEIGLRIQGFGPNLALFTTEEIGGKTYHIMNPDVKNRYFTHVEFSPNTSLDYFLVPKPQGSYRIFCLGGSTTVGYPYGYAGAFSSFLRDRLHAIFPERTIEIVNLGMTATNSYTVNDMARELVEYEPDLFIVYDGHNEFYGAFGAASHESFGQSRRLTKLYLRCIHFKTFQLIRSLVSSAARIFQTPAVATGTMMERLARGSYVPLHSATYERCLENFKSNLLELKQLCLDRHIPLVVSSQASNLRDQPPFVSGEAGGGIASSLARATNLYEHAAADSALQMFRRMLITDSLRADVHYHLAKCLDRLGQKGQAQSEYVKARDLDQLRFRAASEFNDAIRNSADGKQVYFADIERAFNVASPDSIIDNNLIVEHLHPNARGYFLIAKAYAEILRQEHLLASDEEWRNRDTVSDDGLWRRTALTDVDELAAKRRTKILVSGWPFRSGHSGAPTSSNGDPLNAIVEDLVRARMTWEEAHVAAAELYKKEGKFDKTEEEYRALMNQLPLNVSAYLILGQLYLQQNKTLDAYNVLLRSLDIEKTMYACKTLGGIALDKQKPQKAISFFEDAFNLSVSLKDRSETGYFLGCAQSLAGMKDLARAQLQRVLEFNPTYRPAQALLKRLTQ